MIQSCYGFMKKKLTIIEIDYHSEVLRNLMVIISNTSYESQVITTKKIWSKTGLAQNNVRLLFVDDFKGGVKELVGSNLAEINDSRAIIFNTVSSHYKFFSKQQFLPAVLVRIHNVNTSFLSPWKNYKLKLSLYFIWKDFSHFVRRELVSRDFKWRKIFYSKIDGFSFFGKQMEEHAKSSGGVDVSKIVTPALPNTFYESKQRNNSDKNGLVFTVIGGIDRRRRDYELLIKALKIVQGKSKRNITIILLGRPISSYGTQIQRELKALHSEKLSVELFNEFVEQEVFDETLSRTNYLVNPLKEVTRHTVYTEYYGNTKISGAVNEMIQYGLPAVFPDFYDPVEGLENEHFSFKNTPDGLAKTLLAIIDQHQDSGVSQNYSRLFSLNEMSLQMERAIDNLIDKKNA